MLCPSLAFLLLQNMQRALPLLIGLKEQKARSIYRLSPIIEQSVNVKRAGFNQNIAQGAIKASLNMHGALQRARGGDKAKKHSESCARVVIDLGNCARGSLCGALHLRACLLMADYESARIALYFLSVSRFLRQLNRTIK